MDFKSPRYSSTLSSLVNGEQPLVVELERESNPFTEAFPDPLCKLNLKETSEFVKSFPRKRPVVDPAPSTPGRPVFRFSPSHHRKSFPSKWDDAEKWLVSCSSSSCHDSPAHHHLHQKPSNNNYNNGNGFKHQIMEGFADKSLSSSIKSVPSFHNSSVRGAFNGVLASTTDSLLLKDKFTDEIQPPTKEAFLFTAATMKDAGTEMTPLGSSTATRCHTPILTASPARHNTPLDRSGPLGPSDLTVIDVAHLAKLQLYDSAAAANNWSSREEEEEEISKSLRHFEIYDKNLVTNNNNNNYDYGDNNAVTTPSNESRVARWDWEDEEKAKCCSRYQREEAKIQAWVNLQNAKAEAQSRKLEVKIQKMRSNLEEKLMKRMGVVHRKAEELRESARKQHSEQMTKANQHSQKIFNCSNNNNTNINYHSHFSASCGCFPCNNGAHYI